MRAKVYMREEWETNTKTRKRSLTAPLTLLY